MATVDLAEVQGLILRGYTMQFARYFGLRVQDLVGARRFLAVLIDPDPDVPDITTAAPWQHKPDVCVNLGVTAGGLAALGLPPLALDSFPEAFTQGAAARAGYIGDSGASAPERWLPWLRDGGPDLLLVVFAQTQEALERATDQLEAAWTPGFTQTGRRDGAWLPGQSVHFGFRDGLGQPVIKDVPPTGLPDHQPKAPVGEFLLGYESQQRDYTYPVPLPPELGSNGSFAAFRMLAQDVDAFEEYLVAKAAETGLSEELIAAKMCGRWRNGVPLVLSPDTDDPDPALERDELNDFDYVGRHYADERGYKCPVGAHVRRMYPRGGRVAGNNNHLHRIVRRGIPYGPPYDPEHPRDGVERGLLGLFIGVDLHDQFEFLMSHWANDGQFTAGLGRSKDPLLGANDDGGTFTIQHPEKPVVLEGMPRFISTRGGAYCFLPSISGIRYLSELQGTF